MIQEAVIVSVEDPLEMRRVQVRVYGIHGNTFPEKYLPWAETGEVGGAPDTGTYPVFIKGQTVAVDFENDDMTKPVVVGGLTKKFDPGQKYGETDWIPVGEGSDVPEEAKSPTVYSLLKTHNGAALLVEEKPGSEFLRLVDRAGQYCEFSSPLVGTEVGLDKRGTVLAPSAAMEAKLVGDAYFKAVDLSNNRVELKTEQSGDASLVLDNPRHGNRVTLDKDGLVMKVLGGQSDGGFTLVIDSDSMRLNGVELATRRVVDMLEQFSAMLTQSTKPGQVEPLSPVALAWFNARKDAGIDSEGMKTQK